MRRGISLLIALAILGVLVTIRAIDPLPVVALREAYFDTLQRLAPREPVPVPVRVVDIDDKALAEFGQWPWPRSRMAELTDRLGDLGAAVIVFDVLFAEPDRMSPSNLAQDPLVRSVLESTDGMDAFRSVDTDAEFAQAIARVPAVLGISDAGSDGPAPLPPKAGTVMVNGSPDAFLFNLASTTGLVPVLENAALGTGIVNISPDSVERVVRHVPLVWQSDQGMQYSLPVEALRVALGENTAVLFGDEALAGLSSLSIAEFEIPTNAQGQMRVHYRADISDLSLSAVDILGSNETEWISPLIEGHIVLVGTSAAGLLDIHGTPLGTNIPGVTIHAQILEQILAGQFLDRSDYSNGIEIIELAGMCILMAALLGFFGPVLTMGLGGLAGFALVWNSWHSFTQSGLLVDITFPLVGSFFTFASIAFLQYVFADTERRAIRRSFSKYVSHDVLAQIEKERHNLQLGGEMRDVTVLFSDIRNFTPLSETMTAQEMVALLNDLFTELTDEILAQGGTIDKYIGDSIMAFWNAPIEQPDYQMAAHAAALGMRHRLEGFNAIRASNGFEPIEMSVGIASGQACVGNIGSRERFTYSVIGETVNIAARTETASRSIGYDIVTSIPEDCPLDFATLYAGNINLKGVTNSTRVEILVGDRTLAASPEFLKLREIHAQLMDAAEPWSDNTQSLLEKAASQGLAVDPSLSEFYRSLGRRLRPDAGQQPD